MNKTTKKTIQYQIIRLLKATLLLRNTLIKILHNLTADKVN